MTSAFEMVVGLEVHVQLKTLGKIFCGCRTTFGDPPNANTCPVCLGLPGALPVLNGKAVALGARAALALGCTVHEASAFARKNYFYPDLPKGYQISQFDRPLASQGSLEVSLGKGAPPRRIGITRLHLEEDAGKLLHDRYPGMTAVDLNRAGVPLVEIVSEPDLRSAAEAGAYLRELKLILEYLGVSDANMEESSLRVDANVSARPAGSNTLGKKTEIKNLNSFSAVERALDVEFARHRSLLERGERVVQQTMLWDAGRQTVRPARSKEESHDYRYFPDPDLPPLRLTREWIEAAQGTLPELPPARRARLAETYGLSSAEVHVLTASRALADYFEAVAEAHGDGKTAANWVSGEVLARLNDAGRGIEQLTVPPASLGALLDLVRDGTVSNTAAKRVFAVMMASGGAPGEIAAREGLLQVSDQGELARWVDEVWIASPDEAARFAAGEKKLLGVLVGRVMKASGGRADPRRVNELLLAKVG